MAKIHLLNNTKDHTTVKVKRKGVHAKTKTSTSKNSKLYKKRKTGQG